MSDTVLTGFKAGAAIVIAGTQLPKLLGIDAGAKELFPMLAELAGRSAEVNPYALGVGLAGIALLAVGQYLLPARPVALLVVVASLVASHFFELGKNGVAVVGELPAGLPGVALPVFGVHELRLVLPLALGCFLLAFVEGITAARTFAEVLREKVDANRELLALGAGNLVSGLVQAFPAAGGMSQSAVNAKAGARSPLSLVFAALAIGGALLFLTHLLGDLPMPILAAIFSVVMLLRWAANPHTAELGRIPGTDRFGDVERHHKNETFPGVLIFRVEGGIFYFNVDSVKEQLLTRVEKQREPLLLVIFDLSSSPQVDLAGVRMLGEVHDRLEERGIALELAEIHHSVRELLRAEGIDQRFGKITRKTTCSGLLDEWLAQQPRQAQQTATLRGPE